MIHICLTYEKINEKRPALEVYLVCLLVISFVCFLHFDRFLNAFVFISLYLFLLFFVGILEIQFTHISKIFLFSSPVFCCNISIKMYLSDDLYKINQRFEAFFSLHSFSLLWYLNRSNIYFDLVVFHSNVCARALFNVLGHCVCVERRILSNIVVFLLLFAHRMEWTRKTNLDYKISIFSTFFHCSHSNTCWFREWRLHACPRTCFVLICWHCFDGFRNANTFFFVFGTNEF